MLTVLVQTIYNSSLKNIPEEEFDYSILIELPFIRTSFKFNSHLEIHFMELI
jgi:hypothetical protein